MIFSKSYFRYSLILIILGMGCIPLWTRPAIAEKEDTAIYEDNLTTSDGLRWGGGSKLPFRKAVDIKDSLVGTPLGKVTADRYGENVGVDIADLILGPYGYPVPGRTVFISLWGSKIEGCFVEMVVQHAPNGDQPNMLALTPKLLELGIGSQLIELPPQSSTQPKVLSQAYSYTIGTSANRYTSTWYMTRNLFVVDATIANLLSNAPSAEVRARLTMVDDRKVVIPIKKETVSSWKKAYSFNPSCQSAEMQLKQRQLAEKPLLGAFENYSGSDSQKAALDWLQQQITPTTLAQFGHNWRGEPLSARNKPIRLVDAGKFYSATRQQKAALEWLENKIPPDILKEFVQKWN